MTSSLNAAAGVNVDLVVEGLRNMKGQVMVCLTTNPKGFPDCTKDSNAVKRLVKAGAASSVRFEGVTPGTYAIALVHDENSNNKMDLRVFLPREGFGFSRNPAIGMGPPKFKSAAFTVGSADIIQRVKMKYLL